MKTSVLSLALAALTFSVTAEPIDWRPTKTDTWKTFTRYHFTVEGCPCWVAVPPTPRAGNPWVWCMIFPTAFDTRTGVAPLVEDGFYYIHMDVEALAFKGNPVDILEPLAKAGVPLIHVVGDADTTVPVAANTAVIEQRYKALGGTITVFHKPTCGHHPHGLDDPTPVVELIKTYTTRWDPETCK